MSPLLPDELKDCGDETAAVENSTRNLDASRQSLQQEQRNSGSPSSSIGNNNNKHNDDSSKKQSRCNKITQVFTNFCQTYEFPLLIVIAIALARAYPKLGSEYLKPDITSTWIAVCLIFVLTGLGLRTDELKKACKKFYFNGFVQIYNFLVVSSVVFGFSRLAIAVNALDTALADGMVIGACVPMAINIVIVLSASTGANEAAAVFNATFGNIIGIFLSPVLILMYLGTTGEISLGNVFYKLTLRVVVPLIIGQVIQKTSARVRDLFRTYKNTFKKVQELALVYIVYTVFCRTFQSSNDNSAGIANVMIMIVFQLVLLLALMVLAWYSLRLLFRDEPELRIMGVYGCVQKTVSLGIPLITSIYEGDKNEGLYTLPILIWHPMQLVIGSILVKHFRQFIIKERKRIDDKNGNRADAGEDVETGPQEQDGDKSNSNLSSVKNNVSTTDATNL